jgi:hypothetical protein
MHGYRLTKAMDLSKFVHSKFPAIEGPPAVPETYMVSKELVAYLETLVVCCLPSLSTTGQMMLACRERWKHSTARPSNATNSTNTQIFTSTQP